MLGHSAGHEAGHFKGYGEGMDAGYADGRREGLREASVRIEAMTRALEQQRKGNEPVKRLAELN